MSDRLGPYALDTIVTGDARELAKAIPDESVDLIFTDPVYDRIDDYRWLAETAARVLKPNSAALVFCGIGWLGETITALQAGGLAYQWQFILSMPYRNGARIPGGFSHYITCLWMTKGRSRPHRLIPDTMLWRPDTGPFKWAKNPGFVEYYVGAFTQPGAIVADFFSGSGTTAAVCKMLHRRYLAFEVDPATAERARERVRNTQPPLPLVMPTMEALL